MYGGKKSQSNALNVEIINLLKLFFLIIRPYLMLTLDFQSDSSMSMTKRALLKLRRRKDMIHDPLTIAPLWLNEYWFQQMVTVHAVMSLYNSNAAGLNSPAPVSCVAIALRLLSPVYSLFCLVISALNRNNNRRLNRSQIQPVSLEGLRTFILCTSFPRKQKQMFYV